MKNKRKSNKKRVFLDYASITPVDSGVEKEMIKIQKKIWANPSSLHTEGENAKNVLDEARIRIARILHCRGNEIFFTSGGTESLNLAIFGTIKSLLKENVTEVSFVMPNKKGIINPESIIKEIKENTILVIVQHANNEIGTIQPISKIAGKIKEYRKNKNNPYPYFLVDASQSVLYENVSMEKLGADLLVLDGIKMYGPRGAGILVVKHGVKISPILFGGGQEKGLRSGTENVVNSVGFALALEIAAKIREKESLRLTQLRNYTVVKILKPARHASQGDAGGGISNPSFNGGLENRLPNNINICFPGQDSELLVIKLDILGFAVSAASACHTLSFENGSYVIDSIGKPECSSSSLRITLGRDTKKSDLDKLVFALRKIL